LVAGVHSLQLGASAGFFFFEDDRGGLGSVEGLFGFASCKRGVGLGVAGVASSGCRWSTELRSVKERFGSFRQRQHPM